MVLKYHTLYIIIRSISMYLIITGPKGVGKSTHLLMLAAALKKQGKTVGGVISRGLWKGEEREGYEIVHPATGESRLLCAKTKPFDAEAEDIMPFCSYCFLRSAFATGNQWIAQGLTADALFIDEVGNMEAAGGGWDLKQVIQANLPVILGVREDVLPKLASLWGITGPVIPLLPGANMLDDIIDLIT
jgi:nucleoside-triphosphatase THEP1